MAVRPPTSGKQNDKFHCHRSGYGKNGYLEALIRIAPPAGANRPSGEEKEVSGVLGGDAGYRGMGMEIGV